ncbi:zinc-binding alcohol dehydrogenase family protein [Paenibacillus sp.]|uniref:zinc-binding alcohol dehydrogenase family protein n=1 Tax=Paenibacillus sp. TaxID=58172 RepID=UPI00281168A6|nr:zinc-binding alcohol dehydrogenase family protein [Paenibacillus sp.]
MRGIVCDQVGRLVLRDDLPEPERRAGEAVVRIRRVGICGTDYHAFRGNQPFFAYPRILGHELAGVVESIDDGGASGLTVGDRVGVIPYLHCGECIACRRGKTNCCTSMRVLGVHVDGGMRERIAVPASHLIRTNGLSLDAAAMIEPLAIGAHAVRRSGLRRGETALVVGGGPIGLGVMAFAKYAGAAVIAMDVNEERLAFGRDWAKADATLIAGDGAAERLLALTGGDGPTVVFDATGNATSMENAFGYVAHGGTLVFVGLVKNDLAFSDPEFHKRELTLLASRNATRDDFVRVVEAIEAGDVDIERFITHRAALGETVERFDEWLRPESKVVKAVLEL